VGIFRTNNIEHDIRVSENQTANIYAAVYKAMSRINHRCVSSFWNHACAFSDEIDIPSCAGSNTRSTFNVRSFSIELRAIKDIKAGDEICVTYCGDSPGTTAERQRFLINYGFQCTCASCTSPVSDHLYLKLIHSHKELDKFYESWLKDLTSPMTTS
jgi:hypothetical protein